MFYTYMIFNCTNGKIYIGQSQNKYRWAEHLYAAKNPSYSKHKLVHKAISKYGKNNFEFRIIQYHISLQEVLQAETYWINFYQSNVCKYPTGLGYNLTDGGEHSTLGLKWSEESKLSFSKATTGELNNAAIITNEQAQQIKNLLLEGKSTKIIAEMFNLTQGYIQQIKKGIKRQYLNVSNGIKDIEAIKLNGNAKITTEQAREIKILIKQNISISNISKTLNISKWIVSGIKKGVSWKHINV